MRSAARYAAAARYGVRGVTPAFAAPASGAYGTFSSVAPLRPLSGPAVAARGTHRQLGRAARS